MYETQGIGQTPSSLERYLASRTFQFYCVVLNCLIYYGFQAAGDNGEYQVKNYVIPSGGYRRRGGVTSSGTQLNITNYNLPITVSYLNYIKQRKVFASAALSYSVVGITRATETICPGPSAVNWH